MRSFLEAGESAQSLQVLQMPGVCKSAGPRTLV
jgi:hypothetical protein